MKKALVLLLALAMLLPMACVTPAKAAVAEEPFYCLGWSDFDRDKYPYLEGLLTTSFTNIGEYAKLAYGGGSMLYGSYTDEDVTKVAQAITKEMKARPEGLRYWTLFGPAKIMKLAPDHSIFLEHGVVQLQKMFTDLIYKLKELDCPLDGVVIDIEYVGMGSWYLYTQSGGHSVDYYTKNKNIYAEIVADKRYQAMIRPLLVEYGFPFWPNPQGEKSEIFSICYINKGAEYDLARSIWNTVTRIHLNNYSNIWCYEPLKACYPDASLSDYQSHDSKSWMKLAGITDDGIALSGGNSSKVGTASSFSYYYARPGSSFFSDHKQYASFNDGEYEASGFNGLLYDINFTRHMYSSTDTKQIAPWITYHTYGGKKAASMAYTPYYTELLYHLGMFDPEPFLSYSYVGDSCFDDGRENSTHYQEIQLVHNEIMSALTEVAGYADRKPIELPQYWNAEYVLSGMYANGRNIWRITPNGDEISLADFKVSGKDPTFCVKGQTVTFPGGKILSEATISKVGSHGYWVETDANVMPVMTADEDRYAKYPSFSEDFESYDASYLTPGQMKSGYAWTCSTGRNATTTVVKSGNGKALALNGDVSFQNVTIPAKITAGDSYAEDQTWEITFTLPEGLDKEAVIRLLNYTGEGARPEDGGIKIQDGKLYYGALVDGIIENKVLTDVKPGTYTVKRVMDMNAARSFFCDIFLLDDSGKEVASVKNVACPAFSTINSIGFSAKYADKPVLIDNYKLYPSGIATDFELYDSATGVNVKGKAAETPRDRGFAYRLSWLNGTDSTKTYTVTAAYYENGNLKSEKAIEKVTMRPGCDSVETGIVDVKAGQTVKVYLKAGSIDEAEPTAPTVTPTKQTEETTEEPKEPTKQTQEQDEPTKETKNPTKATKNPTKATKNPVKVTKNPVKVTKETQETQATKNPTKVTKEPTIETEEADKPTKATKNPTKETQEPSKATEEADKPTKATKNPTKQTQEKDEPTKATKNPTKATKEPTKATEDTNEMEKPEATKNPTKATRPVNSRFTRPTGATNPEKPDAPEETEKNEAPEDTDEPTKATRDPMKEEPDIPEDEEPEDQIPEDEIPEDPEDDIPEDEEPKDEEPEEDATADATTDEEIPEDEEPEADATEDATTDEEIPEDEEPEDEEPEEDATADATTDEEIPEEEEPEEDATTDEEIPEEEEPEEEEPEEDATEDATTDNEIPEPSIDKGGMPVGVIIAIIAVVVLAGAGAAYWYFFIYKKTAAAPEATEENTEE